MYIIARSCTLMHIQFCRILIGFRVKNFQVHLPLSKNFLHSTRYKEINRILRFDTNDIKLNVYKTVTTQALINTPADFSSAALVSSVEGIPTPTVSAVVCSPSPNDQL